MAKLGFLLFCAVLLAIITKAVSQDNNTTLPPNFVLVKPFGNRIFEAGCADTKTSKPGCSVSCPKKCADECLIFCPTCHTICMCQLPGNVCGDPRFNGGDGNTFYFHGRKNRDFCIVSDSNLHINAHFIGNHNPSIKRDFTWIQSLGILFDNHKLFLSAEKTVVWDDDKDHLNITFDGQAVSLPLRKSAMWVSAAVPGLSVSRSKASNGVVIESKGNFKIMANAVPITEKDSKIHNYGVSKNDSLAHLDLGFKFYNLTDNVHGVLGQTYRPDYVNKMDVRKKMPVMGGAPKYASSDIFATDCEISRFGHGSSVATAVA
ncbi:hypothetical protein LUZ63_017672 [Rhynchospora breviuscula]|uniref:Root cap n=1 Tax=Rhynchospora breviuscula TaxID=2022672 RepID=A0A9Q0C2X0_9POAL|nr:hypothetical protein LUZ63_017672 [Rhynchospora breviuscula]